MSDTEIIERSENLPAELTEAVDASLAVGLSRAEIDTQIATARRYPRQISRVAQSILSLATLDEETAEESMYALPRGGKPIQGPSIRFAEIVKTSYGNCRAAARVVHVDRVEKVVIAEGVFHDLETNTATRAEVRRRICDKYGKLYKDDMIIVTGNAACSIALRNAILGGVPKALWRKAYDAVQHTIAGDVKTLAETRDKAIKALANFGVTPEQVFAALGVAGIEDITIQHIPTLRGMFATLKNGEATVEEMFSGTLPRAGNHAVVRNPLTDDNTEAQREAVVNAPANAPSGDELRASDQEPLSNGSGAAQDRCESAAPTNSNSSQACPPGAPTETDEPASAAAADAGNQSRAKEPEADAGSAATDMHRPVEGSSRPVDGRSSTATSERMDETAGETAPNSGLPEGWQAIYAKAMTRVSDKPKSLATRRTEALKVIGGTPSEADRAEMEAMEDLVKRRNSGELSPDAFKAALREIVPDGGEA